MDVVTTIATVPAVIALSTIAKDMGFPVRFIPVLAILFGVALQTLQELALGGVGNWYQVVSMGLILGLSASGVYDGAKTVGTKYKHSKKVSS